MKPKVSVIVPAYNSEKYIEQCLNSIIIQSYHNLQIIVVIDGGSDNTYRIVQEIAKKDKRISIIWQQNSGSGIARNNGLNDADGEYIVFIDSDDWIEVEMIEHLVERALLYKVDFVLCGHRLLYYDKNTLLSQSINSHKTTLITDKNSVKNSFFDLYMEGITHGPVCKLYRNDIIKRFNVKFPNLRRSQDIFFNNQYFRYIESLYIDENCYYNVRIMDFEYLKVKLPADYYKTIIMLEKDLFATLDYLCIDITEAIQERISSFLMIRIGYCCEAIVINNNVNDSNLLINNMFLDDRIQVASKLSKKTNFYQKLFNFLVICKQVNLIIFLIKIKTVIKLKFPKLFNKIREVKRYGTKKIINFD